MLVREGQVFQNLLSRFHTWKKEASGECPLEKKQEKAPATYHQT